MSCVYDEVGKAIGEAHDLQALLEVILQQLASAAGDWLAGAAFQFSIDSKFAAS